MTTLQDILYRLRTNEIRGSLNKEITSVAFDSRKVIEGSLFVAIVGTQVDGHNFIQKSIDNGAVAIVCNVMPSEVNPNITYVVVSNTSEALGYIASNYYNEPSNKLKVIGITGTNGKTTIVTLLYNLFTELGYSTGMLSTIQNKVNKLAIETTHTTPDALKINELLSVMVDEGCEYVFMEVSSHAIVQHRVTGIKFSGGVFTNITHDHLDYHLTFKEYLGAKKKFFDQLPAEAFALTNIDDKNGNVIIQNTGAKKFTYGLKNIASFTGKIIENDLNGMMIKVDGNELYSLLSGSFNAYNILAVYSTAVLLDQNKEEILVGISKLRGVEGRFDIIRSTVGITAIIDYAHTPDALKNILETINSIRTNNEQLITVVGAGGNRDKTKRPIMAKIASLLSDRIILTSDNPRDENPNQILEEMRKGIDPAKKKVLMVIPDRCEAITTAFNIARAGDMILIAGKGHEKYQEIKGIKYPFDDKRIIAELMDTNL